jgi:hypothetical protein
VETDRVGEAADTAPYYAALTNIMQSTNAFKQLEAIIGGSSTTEGKLYALYGISRLDKREFTRLSVEVDPHETVHVQNYCIRSMTTAGNLLAEMSDGRLQQKLPLAEKRPADDHKGSNP